MGKISEALQRKNLSNKLADEGPELHYADDGDGDGDTSAVIYNLAVKTSQVGGLDQTEMVASIHTDTGFTSKRLVLPGSITSAKLAELLEDIASW